jgi:hypothetical protein
MRAVRGLTRRQGEELVVPMKTLVDDVVVGPDGEMDVVFCVSNLDAQTTNERRIRTCPPGTISSLDSAHHVTEFGSRMLESLYAVMDVRTRRIGLAQKNPTSPGAAAPSCDAAIAITHESTDEIVLESCAAEPTCEGDQEYSGPENACVNPDCGQYFFLVLGSDKKCHFVRSHALTLQPRRLNRSTLTVLTRHQGWFTYFFFGSALFALLAAESCLSHLYIRMVPIVRERAEANNDPAPSL